jgi:hypothetical protein
MLMPLMQKLEDNLNVCFVEFSSQATPIKRVMTLVVIPNVTVDDGASTNTLRRHARWWEGLMSIARLGTGALKRVFQRSRDTYSDAAAAAGVNRRQLTAEETVLVQKDYNLTYGGLRKLGTKLDTLGAQLKFAPQKEVRAAIIKWAIPGEYFENVPLLTIKGLMQCLVYVACATDAGARGLDKAVLNNTFIDLRLKPDALLPLPVVYYKFMNDWGGDSDKEALSLMNVSNPCAAKHCTIVGSAKTMRTDETSYPNGSTENLAIVMSRIRGLAGFENNRVAKLGGSHVFYPKQTSPVTWKYDILATQADVVQFTSKKDGGSGDPADMANIRLGLPPQSSVLIVFENKCLGIEAAGSTFPFRQPVAVNVSLPPAPIVSEVRLFLVSDLLAMAALNGMQG